MKKVKTVFKGSCWSSDDYSSYQYVIEIDKEEAGRLLKLIDITKELKEKNTDLSLHELSAWSNNVEIFQGDDDITCDVCKVRIESNSLLYELKNKYNTDTYETDDIMRSDIEAIANM